MGEAYHRVLLFFVDGIGLAAAGPANPFTTVPTPTLAALLGGPLTAERLGAGGTEGFGDGVVLAALDACLGVPGLPQSATGQTTLFTGVNAPAALGRHVTAFPGPRLRAILEEHGFLARAARRGVPTVFANPFTPGYFRRAEAGGKRRYSASTWTALYAGLELLGLDDLAAGRAVAWDMARDLFADFLEAAGEGERLDIVPAAEAGRHLAAVAGAHGLTLYETFYTDMAGHRRRGLEPEEAVRRVDALLGGLLAARPEELTVVLTSDHGNLEASDHTRHTENPVPLLAVGPAAGRFAGLARLDQVAGAILDLLD